MGRQAEFLSELHRAARGYAARGFPVFPCVPGAKSPLVDGAWKAATLDPKQIDEWWTEWPSANIASAPENHDAGPCLVLDADPPLGQQTLDALELEHGFFPDTLAFRTPRGGLHLWFRGTAPSSVAKLGPKLDTRGQGGYVLLPPSTVGGKAYECIAENEIAEAPSWIGEKLAAPERVETSGAAAIDLPHNIERARRTLENYVLSGAVAIEGAGGDDRTYRVCAECLDFGLSVERAQELICEIWNPACEPPWSEEEIETKLANAAAYRQNEVGAYAVDAASVTFAHFAESADTPAAGQPRSRFYPLDEAEQDALTDPAWLVKDLLAEQSTCLLYGPGDSYKSFLALDIALGIASGTLTFGDVPKPRPAFYLAGEGAREISRRRRPAWRIARGVKGPVPFFVVGQVPSASSADQYVEALAEIRKRLPPGVQPGLVVIDTLARAMTGLDENSAKDAGQAVEAADMLKRELGCTILVVHHTGKDMARGARGSTAIMYGFDTAAEVVADTDTKAAAVYVRRQKDGERREQPWTFEGRASGPSIAFHPTDQATHRLLTAEDDPCAPKKVGAALATLGANGPENAVTSMTLASALLAPVEGQRPEDRLHACERMARVLRKAAEADSKLEAYATGRGRDLRWFLPVKS